MPTLTPDQKSEARRLTIKYGLDMFTAIVQSQSTSDYNQVEKNMSIYKLIERNTKSIQNIIDKA